MLFPMPTGITVLADFILNLGFKLLFVCSVALAKNKATRDGVSKQPNLQASLKAPEDINTVLNGAG